MFSKQLETPLKLNSDFVSPICVGEAVSSGNCISLDLQTGNYYKYTSFTSKLFFKYNFNSFKHTVNYKYEKFVFGRVSANVWFLEGRLETYN